MKKIVITSENIFVRENTTYEKSIVLNSIFSTNYQVKQYHNFDHHQLTKTTLTRTPILKKC